MHCVLSNIMRKRSRSEQMNTMRRCEEPNRSHEKDAIFLIG